MSRMPARALDGWWAYYQLEPWDLPRECWPDVRKQRGGGAAATTRPVKWMTARRAGKFFARRFG